MDSIPVMSMSTVFKIIELCSKSKLTLRAEYQVDLCGVTFVKHIVYGVTPTGQNYQFLPYRNSAYYFIFRNLSMIVYIIENQKSTFAHI